MTVPRDFINKVYQLGVEVDMGIPYRPTPPGGLQAGEGKPGENGIKNRPRTMQYTHKSVAMELEMRVSVAVYDWSKFMDAQERVVTATIEYIEAMAEVGARARQADAYEAMHMATLAYQKLLPLETKEGDDEPTQR